MELETLFTQVEEIIEKMQDNEISLEESFSLYESGMKALIKCNDKIDTVEKKMLQVSQDGELSEF